MPYNHSMILKRKIYAELLNWKEKAQGKSAVLIEGAHRVGKSTVVEEFAKAQYKDYIILDFARENKDIRQNFEDNIDNLDVFFRNLFILKGKELPKREAVVIFDEVQLFPKARQAIKYLVQDGRYDYIETGSLISIKKNVQNILIPSEEHKLKMFPLDFEEFLWAQGNTAVMPAVQDAYEHKKPLGDAAHRQIMKLFRTYMAVGGMPQAVVAYSEGSSFQTVDAIKQEIISLYEDDLKKYDSEDKEKASLIFKSIPKQLSDHGAHFVFSEVDKKARYKNYIDSVEFVAESMIGNRCSNVTVPDVFLELYADKSNFKLYMGDTGLLVSLLLRSGDQMDQIYKALIFDRLNANIGMIVENCVAQMLRARGYDLFFHEYVYKPSGDEKEKKYEIDFLIVKDKKICPIEVKSSDYRVHKSFDYFIKKYPIKVKDRFILYTKDVQKDGTLTYIPLYMAGCL